MKTFTKKSLEELKKKVDLTDLISSYIKLKKYGSFSKGLCPFHEEETPSFVICTSNNNSHYHCFGCGAHGNAIEFLMSYHKLAFIDAVELLASKYDVILEETKRTPLTKEQRIKRQQDYREAIRMMEEVEPGSVGKELKERVEKMSDATTEA